MVTAFFKVKFEKIPLKRMGSIFKWFESSIRAHTVNSKKVETHTIYQILIGDGDSYLILLPNLPRATCMDAKNLENADFGRAKFSKILFC